MDELPHYSSKRFRGAIGDALRNRRGNDMGDYSKTGFAREVAEYGSWSENTIKGYLKGARNPTPAALQAMATLLELPAGAAYFMEYRLHEIAEKLTAHPDLERAVYDDIMASAAVLEKKGESSTQRAQGGGKLRGRRDSGGGAQKNDGKADK